MNEYKRIVNKISTPAEKKTKQKDYLKSGKYPIIDQGQEIIGGYTDKDSKLLDCVLPVIVFGDHTKCVKYIDFPFCPGADGIKVLQPKEGVLPKYLLYLTMYLTFKIEDKGYARHYQYIEKKIVDVPDVHKQAEIIAKIEELFSNIDEGINTINRIALELDVYRKAVLKSAFEGDLTEQWREKTGVGDFSEYYDVVFKMKEASGNKNQYSMMEDIELPQIPNSWKWVYIGDIVSAPEYGTSKKSDKVGLIPVLRMGNMKNGIIDWEDLVFSNDEDDNKKYILCENDILFNRTNSPEHVGKTSIFKGNREAIFAGYIIRMNQLECVNAQYIVYYMNSFVARKYANRVKTDGVNQSNINSKKLMSYPFPLCSIEEQEQIVFEIDSRLSICESIEQTIKNTLVEAEALRQSVLKKAFEGGLA